MKGARQVPVGIAAALLAILTGAASKAWASHSKPPLVDLGLGPVLVLLGIAALAVLVLRIWLSRNHRRRQGREAVREKESHSE